MSSTTDRIKGGVNQVAGAMKRNIGRVTGNPKLQAEGTAQEVRGKAQTIVGEAKQGVRDAAMRVRRSF